VPGEPRAVLEGAPTIELKPAATHDSVTEILNDAFAPSRLLSRGSPISANSATTLATCRTSISISTW